MSAFSTQQKWYLGMCGVGIVAFLLDRVTKYISVAHLQDGIIVIPRILHLEFLGNTHFLFYWDMPVMLMYSAIAAVLGFVLYMTTLAYRQQQRWHVAFLMFVCIGAISNVLDRIQYGYVIDFINVPFWAVFNFADVYIVIGVLLLLIDTWKHDTQRKAVSTPN